MLFEIKRPHRQYGNDGKFFKWKNTRKVAAGQVSIESNIR